MTLKLLYENSFYTIDGIISYLTKSFEILLYIYSIVYILF